MQHLNKGAPAMTNKVYKLIELTGTSTTSLEDAIQGAVTKAAETVRGMSWFEVVETRGRIEDGQVAEWQVILKIGFVLED
jgi:flavin-binding protein dodecin